jgi:hypothetical protein
MNTRRFPRTTGEAFGGCEYACAVERPAPNPYPRWIAIALWIGLITTLVARS